MNEAEYQFEVCRLTAQFNAAQAESKTWIESYVRMTKINLDQKYEIDELKEKIKMLEQELLKEKK